MREINLDEARAARAEAIGEPILVVFGGRKFELPAEYPARIAFDAPDDKAILLILLGDEQFAEFMALEPSWNDITTLLDQATIHYGADLGKLMGEETDSEPSTSSPEPSKPTGTPSKPTGRASTTRASRKKSGATSPSASGGSST